MNDDRQWRLLNSGELVHVAADLTVDTQDLFTAPPAHPLSLTDLTPDTAASQQAIP